MEIRPEAMVDMVEQSEQGGTIRVNVLDALNNGS
jgi:hypothetical protein